MTFQVWSDNETNEDLLGFRVHADLIRSVATDKRVLPIVVGLFGDWGGGKSSIMRMLQEDLNGTAYANTACLYFNGWMFEGYEDAKTALLSSILIQLGEHKRFGPALKDNIVGLLKRVKWMEVAKHGIKHVGIPVAAALLTGGVGGVVAAASSVTGAIANAASSEAVRQEVARDSGNDTESARWSDLVEQAPGKPDVLEVRKFRDEFAAMVAQTDMETLVILLDDLDRCLPERIIETLEAIKLFVAVPKTAFVIGADPRIVRHAIAIRYAQKQIAGDVPGAADEQYDLVKDYLEKLIQIPYHLPRLSPSEIETYVNLLACQQALDASECAKVLDHWKNCRKRNMYAAYRQAAICDALGSAEAVPKRLLAQLAWSNAIADVVTDGLKGNPRQVKRMLNAMSLRKQLAAVADIQIHDDVLAKLMVLEYARPLLFQELSQWQAADNGFPAKLKALEKSAIESNEAKQDEGSSEWFKPTAQNWLRMQPGLAEVDLRDYFWLARDRTSSTLSGVMMVPPIVRRLFDTLASGNTGEQKMAAKEAAGLAGAERSALLTMLQRQIERHPEQVSAIDGLILLGESGLEGSFKVLVTALKNCPAPELEPGVAYRVKNLAHRSGDHQAEAKGLLDQWAKDARSKVGRAAAKQARAG
ncbi:MAG: KAP family P-loop NTPase fold protein [Terriglobales bacterium]